MEFNMKKCLFHSPGYWSEKTKEKLKTIISSGYIYNREDMLENFGDKAIYYFECTNPSGETKWISLSKYPILKERILTKYLNITNENDAYTKYVLMYYRLVLILDNKILKDFIIRKRGYYNELQVFGSISFNYVKALSISLENSDKIINMSDGIETENEVYEDLKTINDIYEVLLKHNINIPVVDSGTGRVLKKTNLN